MANEDPRLQAFERLLNIMDELREQCPWDKKQTFESLRKLTIEETYELADAIDNKDLKEIENEIGDLMLHMVFYAKLGSEQKAFDITSSLNHICEKLIYRHPHIYGDVKVKVKDEEEVKANWEKLKLKEGRESVLEGGSEVLTSNGKSDSNSGKGKRPRVRLGRKRTSMGEGSRRTSRAARGGKSKHC